MGSARRHLTEEECARFDRLAKAVVEHEEFIRLKDYIQHGSVTTYEHCISVAEQAFLMNLRLHIGADEKELVTACLLHDFYHYDWHTHKDSLHGYHHPLIAERKAVRTFKINPTEARAIRTHMWPLTLFHVPAGRVAWLLTGADKICSVRETVRR